MAESKEESLGEIYVQVKFSGIQKDELDCTGKVLQIGKLKVPISRFGSWVFHFISDQNEIDGLLETGIPAVLFIWALYKSYPEITAWVLDPKDCSFVFDVERKDKRRILDEIIGKMKENIQKFLPEIQGKNLKITLIRLLTQKPALLSSPAISTSSSSMKSKSNKKKKKSDRANGNLATGPCSKSTEVWRLIKLRNEIETSADNNTKLWNLLEFCVSAYEMKEFDQAEEFLTELNQLLPNVQIPSEDVPTLLQEIKKLQQQLFDDSNFTRSVELIIASAEFVKKIKNEDERLESINSDLRKVCDGVARTYGVKSSCFEVSVGVNDEVGRSRPDRGSQTLYAQAMKAQQSGKRAFKRYEFGDALRCYESAIKLEPKKMLYHLDIAEVFFAQGELEKCKAECNEALRLAEEGEERLKSRAFAQLGEVELRMCRPVEALWCFGESQKLKHNQDIANKISKLRAEFDRGCKNMMRNRNEVNCNSQLQTVPNLFAPFLFQPHLPLPLLGLDNGFGGLYDDDDDDDDDDDTSDDGYLDE